jgi:hypothetical protein
MWGRLLIGAALSFLSSAALACSCDDARQFSPAEIEKAARYLVSDGFIVLEVERIDKGLTSEPQRFAVKRTLIGADQGSTLALPAD